MNVLFFVYNYSKDQSNSGLQKDLITKFAEKNHKVYVVSMSNDISEEYKLEKEQNNINVLYVKTGKMYENKNKIKKALTVLLTPYYFKKYFFKYFSDIQIDCIIGYAPYNVNLNIVKALKKKYNSKSYLQIWDFFPDNALDLGIIKNKFIYKYFKIREEEIYKVYDILISNSEGGINYLNDNYPKIKDKRKILIRNCEYLRFDNLDENEIIEIRKKYGYEKEDRLLIYGGNIGVAQELENLIEIIDKGKISEVKILIIGYGTEKQKLEKLIESKKLVNIKILSEIPRIEYEKLILASNAGIISLNKHFKVPNAPTKLTTYLKAGKPIFALLDNYTKNDLGRLIEVKEIGVWSKAGDIESGIKKFKEFVDSLTSDSSEKCINFYKQQFDIEKAYEKIILELGDGKNV